MIANRNFEHCEPITWVGQMPVYLSTVLAAFQAGCMVLTALMMAFGGAWFFDWLAFSPFTRFVNFSSGRWCPTHLSSGQTLDRRPDPDAGVLWPGCGKVCRAHIFAWLYGLLLISGPLLLTVLRHWAIR